MPPKKQKSKRDIKPYLNQETVSPGGSSSTTSTQPEEASTSQMRTPHVVRVKKEEEDDTDFEQGPHSRQFKVKFSNDSMEYTVDCDQACTVLEVIKSHLKEQFQMLKDKERNYSDEKLIIQLSNESIIATHFPCSCIENDECLTVRCKTEEVQKTKSQHDRILPRKEYSVFYIFKEGGKNTKTKTLFKSNTVKEFDYLCVYAKKGTPVEEALEKDGRFTDLKDFKLSEVENSKQHTLCTQKVNSLDQKKFKICLPKQKKAKADNVNTQTSSEQQEQQEQQKFDTKSVLDEAKKSRISVKTAMEESDSTANNEEINKLLYEQFQDLKILMESRFPGDTYQKALELKKENFGKIQQSFSEVHRVKKLLELGKSVCKVIVSDVSQGTGFVLFDRFILTNAHLFKGCVTENKLHEGTEVYALFNYDEPEPNTKFNAFTAEKTFIDFDMELDYAILELKPKAWKDNTHKKSKTLNVPPGLLSKFGPPPKDGEACLIGHPAGAVKKIDPTCIIPMEKREEAVDKHLHPYKDKLFTLQSISHLIQKQGIESIMIGGSKADKVVTNDTFMYHGASGSPVFDAQCRVFGLHTAGYCYGFPKNRKSVIEYARPLWTIFENFVGKVEKSEDNEQFDRKKEGKEKLFLKKIFECISQTEQLNAEDSMETNEPTRSEAPQ